MNNLPASTGWDWLKQGTGLFRKQPAALTTLLFANILISIALSAVPFIGPVLAVVLVPSFSMAFMQACLMIENGARVTPAVLLTGFRQPALASLCKVGLIYFAVAIVLMIITQLLGIQELVEKMSKAAADPKNPPEVSAMDMLPLFGLFLLDVAIMVTLCFTAPLTYWKHMGPGKAAFYSFFAVVRTARVFLVMLVSWFALFLGVMMVIALVFGNASIGRVVMIWLMFLFVLLLQCAMYAGYRTIFGKPNEKDMQPA